MKKYIATALLMPVVVCAMAALNAAQAAPAGTTAERHLAKGLQCTVCHVNGDQTRVVRKAQCLACHMNYETLAKRTADKHPNPHANHFGDRDCSTCHKGHGPSQLTCNRCHKFDLKTP